jgi:hypothetical protein
MIQNIVKLVVIVKDLDNVTKKLKNVAQVGNASVQKKKIKVMIIKKMIQALMNLNYLIVVQVIVNAKVKEHVIQKLILVVILV